MPQLTLDDVILYYDERPANPEYRRGPDLLLLHGFGVTARVWEPMTTFVDPGRRVVAIDARNHGRSGAASEVDVDTQVSDVLAVIDRLHLDRPVLVGSSIGAVFATEIAARHPATISEAVLVGGIGHSFATVPGFADANASMLKGLSTDLAGTAEAAVPTWFGPLAGPAVHRWVIEQMMCLAPHAADIMDTLLAWDPRAMLSRVEIPMHYVHGRLDSIDVEVARDCAALSARARVTVAEHAGHMPHIELPGWFAGVIA